MTLYDFKTKLNFGQHKDQTVRKIMETNPTYIEWCYQNLSDFYITDSVYEALDCHKGLNHVLKSGEINPKDVVASIVQNRDFHREKKDEYIAKKVHKFQISLENKMKGT